ncbi:hypothetical protein [Dehalogenimonas etheniformans]|uniref:B12-binding N-terminal domain-containing protein n=1 Tax=Dehalogenimonas etheniformans TaxID=1536648 RepID=A0A2P5P7X2_9CHLR|nr:hypothetical protein [Dehalogenimonas etheniformans]PPD58408.1 hypothetical protein JP09_004700 [Dehalogenimonas etheniformans]QNT76981.1 hypothetical protein HX448_09995 [Dehalogenimonas etheniformans]
MPAISIKSSPFYSNLLNSNLNGLPDLSQSQLLDLTIDVIRNWDNGKSLSAAEFIATLNYIKVKCSRLTLDYKYAKKIPVVYFSNIIPTAIITLEILLALSGIRTQRFMFPNHELPPNLVSESLLPIMVVTVNQYHQLPVLNVLRNNPTNKYTMLIGGNVFNLIPELKTPFKQCLYPKHILDIPNAINDLVLNLSEGE